MAMVVCLQSERLVEEDDDDDGASHALVVQFSRPHNSRFVFFLFYMMIPE